MGLIYLSYIVLLSIFVFFECRSNKQPIWWSGVAFAFPPAAFVVLSKTRKNKTMVVISAVAIAFVLALGGEWLVYSTKKKKKAANVIPPIIKKIIQLNEDVKKSTIDIYNASGKLLSLSMAQSRVGDLEKAIEVIKSMRLMVEENQKSIDRLIQFTEDHEPFFYQKDLEWVFLIREFYSDRHVVQYHTSRAKYLAAFEKMADYTLKHFNEIMELLSSKHMKTYDVYYMRYRTAADTNNRFNRKRIAFQKEFIQNYPKVKPFLPGVHHEGPFKFWDKFSF